MTGAGEGVRRVVVVGSDPEAVGRLVRRLRDDGARVAGHVGRDEESARAMGTEMLGGVDEVVCADEV
ncbi:MAG TPA: hypothetical protein VHE80_08610 [Acidimicrobiales bacterium]|nr:hypothetical protein [Acidimicrobiales bacterium]